MVPEDMMDFDMFPRYRPLTPAEIETGEAVTRCLRVAVIALVDIVGAVILVAFAL